MSHSQNSKQRADGQGRGGGNGRWSLEVEVSLWKMWVDGADVFITLIIAVQTVFVTPDTLTTTIQTVHVTLTPSQQKLCNWLLDNSQ